MYRAGVLEGMISVSIVDLDGLDLNRTLQYLIQNIAVFACFDPATHQELYHLVNYPNHCDATTCMFRVPSSMESSGDHAARTAPEPPKRLFEFSTTLLEEETVKAPKYIYQNIPKGLPTVSIASR